MPLIGLSLEQEVYRRDAIYRQPDWTFDTTLARYRDRNTGRFLSERDALQLTQRSIEAAGKDLDDLVVQLDQGLLDLATWQRQAAALIKSVHLAQFILGRGGIANVVPADFLTVARTLRQEYGFLERFGQDLAANRLSAAQARARARLYLNKARLSYWQGREQAVNRGPMPSEMRRFLAPVEHCAECVAYAAAGWVPVGQLPMPTVDCSCRSNCRCTVAYR